MGKSKKALGGMAAVLMAGLSGGMIPMGKPETLDGELKNGQYPFTDQEIEEMRAIEDFKERKKYIKQLKKKYQGMSKK